MPSSQPPTFRRLELTLRKPLLAVWGWIKPTVVVDGRGHPAQWGTGTWQVSPDQPTTVAVYLFNRLWRFGEAEYHVSSDEVVDLEYTAPTLPFGRGTLRKKNVERSSSR